MRHWNLRKYGYILVWLALAGAVGLAWLLGRDAPPTAGAGELSSTAAAAPSPSEAEPSPDQENLVGLWVPYFSLATAENTQAAFQENYKAIVGQAKEVGVNAMFVHVRPFCDSLYPSEKFPWSHILTGEQGKDPGWDPLAFLVEYTHSQGMEFHAWVNPLRVKTAQTPASLAPDSPYETWKAEHPYYFMEWEGGLYLDPAYPEVRSLIAQGVGEIVENYPVDGVHFDDYFYPSQSGELDEEAYALYTGNTADPLPLLEWRQANINTLVAECYQAVKQADAGGRVRHLPPGEHRKRPGHGRRRDGVGRCPRLCGLPLPPALLQLRKRGPGLPGGPLPVGGPAPPPGPVPLRRPGPVQGRHRRR